MNIWFTADTHFGHANIIKYCNRPFANAKEMDDALIQNWNERVKVNDVVYHVGDFAMSRKESDIANYSRRLHGLKFLVLGNHDPIQHYAGQSDKLGFKRIDWYGEPRVTILGGTVGIILFHYALRVWNKSHHGSWHLYGHSHGSLPDDPNLNSFDIGVDCHQYQPLNVDEIQAIIDAKIKKRGKDHVAIDHHGRR
jgi:calcineurin-like phosphoesterase family protein